MALLLNKKFYYAHYKAILILFSVYGFNAKGQNTSILSPFIPFQMPSPTEVIDGINFNNLPNCSIYSHFVPDYSKFYYPSLHKINRLLRKDNKNVKIASAEFKHDYIIRQEVSHRIYNYIYDKLHLHIKVNIVEDGKKLATITYFFSKPCRLDSLYEEFTGVDGPRKFHCTYDANNRLLKTVSINSSTQTTRTIESFTYTYSDKANAYIQTLWGKLPDTIKDKYDVLLRKDFLGTTFDSIIVQKNFLTNDETLYFFNESNHIIYSQTNISSSHDRSEIYYEVKSFKNEIQNGLIKFQQTVTGHLNSYTKTEITIARLSRYGQCFNADYYDGAGDTFSLISYHGECDNKGVIEQFCNSINCVNFIYGK